MKKVICLNTDTENKVLEHLLISKGIEILPAELERLKECDAVIFGSVWDPLSFRLTGFARQWGIPVFVLPDAEGYLPEMMRNEVGDQNCFTSYAELITAVLNL